MTAHLRKFRWRYVFLASLVLVSGGIAGFAALQERSMINTTLLWARLAPFPPSMRDFRIRAEGSMFTRTFIATFKAPPADIDAWLNRSAGTANVKPEMEGSIRTYSIKPGGGAQTARVQVDEATGAVEVYVAWS